MRRSLTIFTTAVLTLLASTAVAASQDGIALKQYAAQLKLAQIAAQKHDYSQAYKRLRWLNFNDTTSPKRSSIYQAALHKFTNKTPLSYGLSGAFIPSSNIQRTSSQQTFETDLGTFTLYDSDTVKSGLGVSIGANTRLRYAPSAGHEFALKVDINRAIYAIDDLINTRSSLTLDHTWLTAGLEINLGIYGQTIDYLDIETRTNPNNQSYGLKASLKHKIDANTEFQIGADLRQTTYDEKPHLDGVKTTVTGVYAHKLSAANRLTFIGSLSRQKINAEHLSYHGIKFGANYDFNLNKSTHWRVGFASTLRDYDSQFTGLDFARKDRVSEVTLGVSSRKIKLFGTTPRIDCTAQLHGSNVALYDYNAVDCGFSLRKEF